MAPQVGLEPTTLRLTAGCSAIELLRSVGRACHGGRPFLSISIISSAGGVEPLKSEGFGICIKYLYLLA
jgi:hypothetical protein